MPEQDTTATADKATDTSATDDTTDEVVDESKDTGTSTDTDDKDSAEDKSGEGDSKETRTDKSDAADEDQAADDSTAKKDQSRLGYQLRQIRAGDPFVAQAKKALEADYVNVDGLTEDQREIRQMKADQYLEKLETSRAQLVADAETIAKEFDFFNPADKEHFRKDLYDRTMARFGRDSLQMSDPDDQGKQEIVGYKTRLLDYVREEADLILAGRSNDSGKPAPKKTDAKKDDDGSKSDDGAKKDKTDAEMDAASEEVGGASTTKTDSDEDASPIVKDFLAGFDSVK